ncbi:pilus assembly PilX family protein [Cupriavidus campinensis]|uniref:Pilus assembly protein n=1 Tax=Cupriavidus campinensis TaxID=151783 RepID=A0AAE9HZA2_9BURK|nr:pilus assembly protein [Cupriavidus campinensis]TSP12457.1 pilus assembly protein [Cupriavidus campinensis]URF03365.1 pilus assembly protein [Cupriavidus campinensis]
MPVTRQPTRLRRSGRARGVALITAVIMLLVITLLALGGARIALDTKRSTRNQRDFEIAYQAAEAALRDAEMDIQLANNPKSRSAKFSPLSAEGFLAGGCNTGTDASAPYLGLCDTFANKENPIWNTVDWTAAVGNTTVEYGTFTGRNYPTGSGLTPGRKPRYLIEVLRENKNGTLASGEDAVRYMYRITAVGFGPNDTTRAIVQSTYRKSDL